MNEKKTDMAYWGAFSAQDVHAHRLDLRPDVIPMSRGEMHLHACSAILRHGHGFVEACDSGDPKDGDGNWMPLFTYPCVEYLRQFDLRDSQPVEHVARQTPSVGKELTFIEQLIGNIGHFSTVEFVDAQQQGHA